jgi:CheY-like chemotaxis protein
VVIIAARVPRCERLPNPEKSSDPSVELNRFDLCHAVGLRQTDHAQAEAISRVGKFAPELVISDISTPLVNGYDVARAIRKMRISHCPIIAALTALASPQDRQDAPDAGFDHHLQKPMDPAQLDRILDSLVRPC